MRLHGQAVKTPPFHGGNRGSIPLGVTKIRTLHSSVFFREIAPCYAYCFAIRDRLHARVSRHYRASPLPNSGARCKAIPLGVTIPGLLTRYFFGKSSPCYAYCFAIRDRLHAIAPRHLAPRRSLSAIAVRRFPLESPYRVF